MYNLEFFNKETNTWTVSVFNNLCKGFLTQEEALQAKKRAESVNGDLLYRVVQ